VAENLSEILKTQDYFIEFRNRGIKIVNN